MIASRALLLVLACALPLAAAAQWQWVDKDGRRVFSDKAPPPDIPAKSILKQPRGRGQPVVAEPAEPAASAATATAAQPAASGLKVSGKDKVLEDKPQRAENCSRAKNAKATIESGVRLARTNDKGEREIIDDNARAAELQRLQSIIARDCVSAS
jgi:hypothetical protein